MLVIMLSIFGILGALAAFMFSDSEVHDAVEHGKHVKLHH